MTSGGQHWRSVQTCSLEDPPPIGSEIWWLLKHVRLEQVGGTHSTGMLSCFSLCLLPPTNEVWGKVVFHRCLCVHRGMSASGSWGCLPLGPGGVYFWVNGGVPMGLGMCLP